MPKEYSGDVLAKEAVSYTEEGDKIFIVTSDISPVQENFYSQEYSRKFEKLVAYETRKIKRRNNFV